MAQFFTSLFEITAYADNQKKTNEALDNISKELSNLKMGQETSILKIDSLSAQIETVKQGLHLELFESLQNLHERLIVKRWASHEEKADAKRYYDEIHRLGKDGWSEKYYKEIVELPESREELYAKH